MTVRSAVVSFLSAATYLRYYMERRSILTIHHRFTPEEHRHWIGRLSRLPACALHADRCWGKTLQDWGHSTCEKRIPGYSF